ncbi:hypothetical protein JCM19297_3183 [Nonlabens ulvanivorans]|nr:hypothetical protein JCM19297_3183 [Nonlabens ulvanivorans]
MYQSIKKCRLPYVRSSYYCYYAHAVLFAVAKVRFCYEVVNSKSAGFYNAFAKAYLPISIGILVIFYGR